MQGGRKLARNVKEKLVYWGIIDHHHGFYGMVGAIVLSELLHWP